MGWVYHDQDLHTTSLAVPPVPATLRLQQITLAPGMDLPLPPDALFQFAVSLEQGAYVATSTNFDVLNLAQQPAAVHVLTLEPAGAGTTSPAVSPETASGKAAGTPSR